MAEYEYLLFVDQDVETLNGRIIPTLIDAFESIPNVALAQPVLYDYAKADRVQSSGGMLDELGFTYPNLVEPRSVIETFYVAGAFTFTTKNVLVKVGSPDVFLTILDDVDLGWRAQLAGLKCIVVPVKTVLHKGGSVTRSAARSYRVTVEHLYLLLKNYYGSTRLLKVLLVVVLVRLGKLLLQMQRRNIDDAIGVLRGLVATLELLPEILLQAQRVRNDVRRIPRKT